MEKVSCLSLLQFFKYRNSLSSLSVKHVSSRSSRWSFASLQVTLVMYFNQFVCYFESAVLGFCIVIEQDRNFVLIWRYKYKISIWSWSEYSVSWKTSVSSIWSFLLLSVLCSIVTCIGNCQYEVFYYFQFSSKPSVCSIWSFVLLYLCS